jgi:hypothetical protein
LQQAEKDKQDYEAARKVYEEDAAARARGEDVPMRTYPEPAVDVPKPVIKEAQASDVADKPLLTVAPNTELLKSEPLTGAETMFGSFSHTDVEPTPEEETPHIDHDAAIEMDGFHGFGDSLGNMDLSFPSVDERNGGQDWGELTNLMGGDESKSITVSETADISVAPALDEAVHQTREDIPTDTTFPVDEPSVREIAQQAEGQVAVPSTEPEIRVGEAEISANASGVPTEEVNEQPTELPPVVDIVQETPVATESNGHMEAPAFSQQISSDSLFSEPASKAEDEDAEAPSATEASDPLISDEASAMPLDEPATEEGAFGDLISDLSAPPAPVDEAASGELPDVSANVPFEVTAQPALDITAESSTDAPTDVEPEAPAIDGI